MRERVGALAGLVLLTVLSTLVPTASAWEVDETASVTRVIDGDTFDATPTGRIRLADIDAPEYYELGYEESTSFLSALIGGQSLFLDIDDVYGTDRYDRVVAVAYVRHNDTHLTNVNKALLDADHAIVSDYTNEFSPYSWTTYVFYPVDAPPPTVTVSVSPTEGFVPFAVSFTSTASGGIPPYLFAWRFGDGGQSSLQNPTHTYEVPGTFGVTLTVTDSARRSTTETVQVVARRPLGVTVSASPSAGVFPLTVSFTAAATGGRSPYGYEWDFGDGNASTSPGPTHTYESPGTYEVRVAVTDADLRTAADSVTIQVTAPGPLAITASADRAAGPVPLTVNLTAAATGGRSPYTYLWDFGDGNSSTSSRPTHTYESPGTYTVTVTVTDADLRVASDTVTIQATASPPSGPSSPPGAGGSPELLVAAIVVAALGVGGIVIWFQRPKRGPPPRTGPR